MLPYFAYIDMSSIIKHCTQTGDGWGVIYSKKRVCRMRVQILFHSKGWTFEERKISGCISPRQR